MKIIGSLKNNLVIFLYYKYNSKDIILELDMSDIHFGPVWLCFLVEKEGENILNLTCLIQFLEGERRGGKPLIVIYCFPLR